MSSNISYGYPKNEDRNLLLTDPVKFYRMGYKASIKELEFYLQYKQEIIIPVSKFDPDQDKIEYYKMQIFIRNNIARLKEQVESWKKLILDHDHYNKFTKINMARGMNPYNTIEYPLRFYSHNHY